jgi:hypothetical protein
LRGAVIGLAKRKGNLAAASYCIKINDDDPMTTRGLSRRQDGGIPELQAGAAFGRALVDRISSYVNEGAIGARNSDTRGSRCGKMIHLAKSHI